MARAAKLTVEVGADVSDASKKLSAVSDDIDSLARTTRKASDDMSKAFDNVDTAKVTKSVRETNDELKKTKDASDHAGSGLGDLGEKFKGVGAVAATGVAAAVAALALIGAKAAEAFSDAFTKALDVEAANDKLAAQLGLSQETAQRYGKLAGSIYAENFGDSLGDVNDAIAASLTNIGNLNDADLAKVTKRALAFTDVFDEDLRKVTVAAGQLVRTGLASNVDEAFDILTAGMQQGIDSGDDLLDTFQEYPTAFRALGITGKQALGIMNQGLKAGARNSDIVADALKEFAIRSKDASDTTREAFKDLGLDADKMTKVFAEGGPAAAAGLDEVFDKLRAMPNKAQQMGDAVKLFGTKAEDLQGAFDAIDPSSAVESLGDITGAADNMVDTFGDNMKGGMESFRRTIEVNVVDFLNNKALPAVKGFGDKAVDTLVGIGTRFSQSFSGVTPTADMGPLNDTIDTTARKVRELADALVPKLQEGWQKVTEKAKEFSDWASGNETLFQSLAIVFGSLLAVALFDVAMSLGLIAGALVLTVAPFAALVGIVYLVIQGFKDLWNNSETFRQIVERIRTEALPALQERFQVFKDFIEGTFLPAVSNVWNAILWVISVVVNAISGLLDGTGNRWFNILKTIWGMITNLTANSWQVISNIFQFFLHLITGQWSEAWKDVQEIFDAIWDTFISTIADTFRIIRDLLFGIAGMVVNVARNLLDPIIGTFEDLIGKVRDFIHSLGQIPSFLNPFGGSRSVGTMLVPSTSPAVHQMVTTRVATPTVVNVNISHTGLGVDSPRLQRDVVRALNQYFARNGRYGLGVG